MQDNNSKFGTLALLRNRIEVDSDPLSLQVGRTCVEVSLISTSCKNFCKYLKLKNSEGGPNKIGALLKLKAKDKEEKQVIEEKNEALKRENLKEGIVHLFS